jgi:hypothetical protein
MISKGGDWRAFNLGTFNLEQGTHSFKLIGKGSSINNRSSVPAKYAVGISSLSLLLLDNL